MSKPLVQHCLELLSHASLRSLHRLGNVLAFIVAHTPNQVARNTRQNIALCFPELSAQESRKLYRESIRQTSYALTELPAIWCWPPERVRQHITRVDVCDSFMQSTRGRIILGPHLGSWEAMGIWLSKHLEIMYLYKPRKNEAFDKFIKESRERSGGTLVPTKKSGLRKLLVTLKRGGNLVILPDQKPRQNKVHIASTFYGIDAPTTTLVHSLCSKLDCDVFIAVAYRDSSSGEYHACVEQLEHARLAGDEIESARYMNEQIEQRVRRCPEQYQWDYRRFSKQAYESVE